MPSSPGEQAQVCRGPPEGCHPQTRGELGPRQCHLPRTSAGAINCKGPPVDQLRSIRPDGAPPAWWEGGAEIPARYERFQFLQNNQYPQALHTSLDVNGEREKKEKNTKIKGKGKGWKEREREGKGRGGGEERQEPECAMRPSLPNQSLQTPWWSVGGGPGLSPCSVQMLREVFPPTAHRHPSLWGRQAP